jgi:CheY-like chemotaxis protein
MNFRSLTQIFSRARPAPLRDEEYPSVGKKKILIVDDNLDIRKLLALFLERSGYDTVEAATGLEAVSQARVIRPNLILMDLTMPVVSGDEAMRWLKADPLTRHIPVIVISGFFDGPKLDRALAVGAADILSKPFHFESLHAMLQRHLSVHYQPRQPDPLGPAPLRAHQNASLHSKFSAIANGSFGQPRVQRLVCSQLLEQPFAFLIKSKRK